MLSVNRTQNPSHKALRVLGHNGGIFLILTILLVGTTTIASPIIGPLLANGIATVSQEQYILVGGQNGTWFKPDQAPRLYKILLPLRAVTRLSPVTSQGTVWGGGWNGSQWLISGWGTNSGPHGSNPYIYLNDGIHQVVAGTLTQYDSEASWHGGDIFSASYGVNRWLLSGLGSDSLPTMKRAANHMSLATFDGYDFEDLSMMVPHQKDAILYTNAWNGRYWLVGGGFLRFRILFAFDGVKITDLTSQLDEQVSDSGSIQTIAWNGEYWLIGGINLLAKFDGNHFVDLTSKLNTVLGRMFTVNAIAWDGHEWMLGGGTPVAQLLPSKAWIATYSSFGFSDLTRLLPTRLVNQTSSILTIAFANPSWILGGYSGRYTGLLLSYQDGSFQDLSGLIGDTSYVIWVGAGPTRQHEDFIKFENSPTETLFLAFNIRLKANSSEAVAREISRGAL